MSFLISTSHLPQLLKFHQNHFKELRQSLSDSREIQLHSETLKVLDIDITLDFEKQPSSKNAIKMSSIITDSGCTSDGSNNNIMNYSGQWYIISCVTIKYTLHSLTPKVLWSQTRVEICLSVQVKCCDHYEVHFIDSSINVWYNSSNCTLIINQSTQGVLVKRRSINFLSYYLVTLIKFERY